MSNVEKWKTLRSFIGLIGVLLSLIPMIASIILSIVHQKLFEKLRIESLSNEHYYLIIGVTLIVTLPCIVIIYFISYLREMRNEKNNILADKLNSILANIKNFPQSEENIITKSKLLDSKEDYFGYLDKAREGILKDKNIRLMNFTDSIKDQQEEEQNAKKWYGEEIEFCLNNKEVNLYRIISIHTIEKYDECKKFVDEAKRNKLINFHLAYLKIDSFDEEWLPKITGVQIIDTEVILMDPTVARIDTKKDTKIDGKYKKPIYINSPEIAGIYSEYYRMLWSEIKKYHKLFSTDKSGVKNHNGYNGFILYDGDPGKTLEGSVWEEIYNNISEPKKHSNGELTDKLDVKENLVGFLKKIVTKKE